MAKTVKLNVAERLYLVSILNGYKGPLDGLHHIQDALRAFAITREEQEKIEFKAEEGRYAWNAEKALDVDGSLAAEVVDYVIETIKKNDEAKTYGIGDLAVLSLRDKLVLDVV